MRMDVTEHGLHTLRVRRLGIDTYHENVVYMRPDCHVCRSEGFAAHARVMVSHGQRSIIATIERVYGNLLGVDEAGLSEAAWVALDAVDGVLVSMSHPRPLESLSDVRAKIYGKRLRAEAFKTIVGDVIAGRLSDIHISAFITACAGDRLDRDEMLNLTRAMVDSGDRLRWSRMPIVDKHCVGGLPGNRTTPIVVAIVTACGLTMPKTSSRAITSPAGTADTMEMLAPVDLDIASMRRVVERENGCIVWGGAVRLSPADDILIRVERALDLDSEGQLVASVLSKKAAAGSTHVLIDIPVGPTAKVRSESEAQRLRGHLEAVGEALGIVVRTVCTDGSQPVGRGIGPALEARDVLAVLRGAASAPSDLRDRAVMLAGALLELAGFSRHGDGHGVADAVLRDGRAWQKFQAICQAQGGLREPPHASYTRSILAPVEGRLTAINNRLIARAAKLAGAPQAPAAGIEMHVRLGQSLARGEPMYTVHAETTGELSYALGFVESRQGMVTIEPGP